MYPWLAEFRLITNLKNLNPFLKTTFFHLPTLHSILPYFKKGMWATSTLAYFRKGQTLLVF